MSKKSEVVPIGVQIDKDLNNTLSECAEKEKRTRRAVVELALEAYFSNSAALNSEKGSKKQ